MRHTPIYRRLDCSIYRTGHEVRSVSGVITTIQQFRERIAGDCSGLITDLQQLTGRFGKEEASAWERSLTRVSNIFQHSSFQPLHLYFGARGNLSLEYQLPAASAWCDMVLLGRHQSRPAAVVIELKDWQTGGDQPGAYEGLIRRHGGEQLHPCEQVKGYALYCRRFHSAVHDHSASVHGCVLFTRDQWTLAYTSAPNEVIAAEYPIFTTAAHDVEQRLPSYFAERLTEPDEVFAEAFDRGKYKQQRGFVAQIGEQVINPAATPFELLDGQRRAFAAAIGTIEESFHRSGYSPPKKRVVIIKGPPGSGKSVIAAKLWAALVTDVQLPEGDVVLTTTSASQNKNWTWLFKKTSGIHEAAGVVRKATSFTPLSTHAIGRLRKRHGKSFCANAGKWRENLKTLRALGVKFDDAAEDNAVLVSIVDEAHALINPEYNEGRGQFGFVVTLGPQAYHIIRTSMLSVFLLDPLQAFRQRENTRIEEIKEWARDLGAGDPIELSLDDVQFRCAGSREYVGWVERLLAGDSEQDLSILARRWRKATGSMVLQTFERPDEMESALRASIQDGSSGRLLATYSRKWRTQTATQPHELEASEKDFNEPYRVDGRTRHWTKIWNFVPAADYSWFVAAHPASYIAADPLCEVGCPYVVRGFDFDYVGIAWLNDLVWRGGQWMVNPSNVHETGIGVLTNAARKEKTPGIKTAELLERVAQAYRILFTRAVKGVFLWIPDHETRAHVLRSLGEFQQ